MFDKTKVTDSFYGLVGNQQPTNPDYAIIDSANLESRSGRFATENPYYKIEYLKENQDYKDSTDEQFNTFLADLQKRSITEVMDKVLMKEDYIDKQVLYQYANNKIDTDTLPETSFVGYKINKSLDKHVAFELRNIYLEFEGTGDVELLLFNTAKKAPIFSKVITIASTQQIEALNWRVDDSNDFFQGEYYLGYLTDGLTVTPIKRDYQNSNVKSVIAHLCFENVQVSNVTTKELWDLTTDHGASESWGLNPIVNVFNDYTTLLINNEAIFAPAIQSQFAINGVQFYISSLRSNRTQRISEDQLNFIIAQLEGLNGRIEGFIPTLRRELTSLNAQLDRLINGLFSTGFEINTVS